MQYAHSPCGNSVSREHLTVADPQRKPTRDGPPETYGDGTRSAILEISTVRPLQNLWTAVESSDLLRTCGRADTFSTVSRTRSDLQHKDFSKCSTNPQALLLLEGIQEILPSSSTKGPLRHIRKGGGCNE